jgi:chromosome segregation ATPase
VSDVNHYDPAMNDPSLHRRDRPLVTTHNTIEQLEQALAEKGRQLSAAKEKSDRFRESRHKLRCENKELSQYVADNAQAAARSYQTALTEQERNEALVIQIEQLQQENAQLKARIAELESEIEQGRTYIEALNRETQG